MHDRTFVNAPTGPRSDPETDFSRRVLEGHVHMETKCERSEGLSSGSRVKRTADFGDADNPAAADSSASSSLETGKSAARTPEATSADLQPCSQIIQRNKKGKLKSRLRSLFTHLSGLTHRQEATERLSIDRGLSTKKASRGKVLSSICSTPSISHSSDADQQHEVFLERKGKLEHAKVSPLTDSSVLCNHFREFDTHRNEFDAQTKWSGSPSHCIGIRPGTSMDTVASQPEYRRLVSTIEDCWLLLAEFCVLAECDIDIKTEKCECLHYIALRPESAGHCHTTEIYRHGITVKAPVGVYSNVISSSCKLVHCNSKEVENDSFTSLSEKLPRVAETDPHQSAQAAEHSLTGIMNMDIGTLIPNMRALSPSHSSLEVMESPLTPGCAADQYEVSGLSVPATDCVQTKKKVPEIIIQGLRPEDQEVNSSPADTFNLLGDGKDQRMETLRVPDRSTRLFVDEWRYFNAERQLISHLEFAVKQRCLIRQSVTSGLSGGRFYVRQSLGDSLAAVHNACTREIRDGNRVMPRMKNMDLFQPFSQSQSTESSSEVDWNPMRSEGEPVDAKKKELERDRDCKPDLTPDPACGTRFCPPAADNDGRLTATQTYIPTSSISLSYLLGEQLSDEGRHTSKSGKKKGR
uniref:Uncharacterized protein n=1 Tax=Schistocephalus solidus TaxID=70667 RepID=A0A0X3PC23_SCHSO